MNALYKRSCRFLIFALLVCTGRLVAQVYTVTTLAGSTQGYVDGIGVHAKFNSPTDIQFDHVGNGYIVDWLNCSLRRMTTGGIVTTIAGNGQPGYSEGTGTNAQFEYPNAVAVHPNGTIYLSDRMGHRIRKITTSGEVSTFAGNGIAGYADGAGTSAQFNRPSQIALDQYGNLFVSDYSNQCIRKITPEGIVSTIAGSGIEGYLDGEASSAQFNNPTGIAVANDGTIYVADAFNHCVRKISPNGTVSTLAGINSAGYQDGIGSNAKFNYPHGLALNKLDGSLYIADVHNHRIRKISPNGTVLTIAGSISGRADGSGNVAKFTNPYGISVDAQGIIYIADLGNHLIRKIITENSIMNAVFSHTVFPEANSNNGSITTTQTITLNNASWIQTIADGATLISGVHFMATNVPAGLTLQVNKMNATQVSIGFSGIALAHQSINSVNNVQITFTDAALNGVTASSVEGLNGVNLAVNFINNPSAAYSGTSFTEAVSNDGKVSTVRTVTLTHDTFVPTGAFVEGLHFTATGVPQGLTLSITRTSAEIAQLSFTGAALNHESIHDATITLTFLNAAVASGNVSSVNGLSPAVLTIDFNDPKLIASAIYSDSVFTEVVANNGQVTTTRTITLTGTTFASGPFTQGVHFTAANVPAGLILTVTRLSSSIARISFSGTALAHNLVHSTNVGLTFLPAVLSSGAIDGVTGLSPKTLRVNFWDPYTAAYSDSTFTESPANDGSVPTALTVTLTGTTFLTTATTLIQGTHFNVSGVPSGLAMNITIVSPTVARIILTGNAAAHSNDINNVRLTFLNAAIHTGNASGVIGLTPKTLRINFIPPYTATYSAKNFIEGTANDGLVPTTRLISLFGGESWAPNGVFTNGVHYTITGVPQGLTPVITRTSSTGAQISFSGKAVSHTNLNDVALTLTFLNAALNNGAASLVIGLTPAQLTIDFRDPELPPPPAPNILGFTPQVGTTGTVVTITGFGFTGTQNVLFGGAPAKLFTVVSDSLVTAIVDYGSTGDVMVVNAQGLATLPGFTFVPRPIISSFTPANGNAGAVITIRGSNFMGTALNGTSWTTSSVYFGGTPATSFTVISATEIQATVGAGATGAVRVETLPGNVGVRNGFCFMAPRITGFSPTSASTGTQVIITGSNFTGATVVRFNGKTASSFTVVSDTEIRAFPAAGTPERGVISVTTPQCTDDLETFTFIPAPVIYGFWLSGGTNGDVITIDGINFTGATAVKFGDTLAASYTIVSPTRIQAVVGHGKTGAVSVIGPGGVGSRSKFIYYAPGSGGRPNPPIITSFTPTEGPNGTIITITGLNFQGTDWFTTAVRIGDAPPITGIIQSMSPTQIKVKINGGNSGKITVYTPAGITTSTQSFTYLPPPTITSFTPINGATGTLLTITGTEFQGVTSVKIGGTVVSTFTVVSPTQITATVGAGTTGKIQVVTTGGTATSGANFIFPAPPPAPVITSFTPAVATSGTTITINGNYFDATSAVSFGGISAQSVTVVSQTRIIATVGAGASGNVQVVTPGGTAIKSGFTYLPRPLPTVTSFSPTSASPGQIVTIVGTYFTGATQVFMGGASVPFTFIHSGKITVEVPINAASGAIRVVTPNGVGMRSGFTFIPALAFHAGNTDEPLSHTEHSGLLTTAQTDIMSVAEFFNVFPNPAQSIITIRAQFAEAMIARMVILNMLGVPVWTQEIPVEKGMMEQEVNLEALPPGVYFVSLRAGAKNRTVKILKH